MFSSQQDLKKLTILALLESAESKTEKKHKHTKLKYYTRKHVVGQITKDHILQEIR